MFLKTKIVRYSSVLIAWLFIAQVGVFAASSIRITELMYNPSGNGDLEFVEFYNGDNVAINMSGWYVVGVGYTIPSGSVLQPGQYAVIVRNYSVFAASFPGAKVFGQYPGKLKSGGELVRLVDTSQNIVSQLSFQNGGAWPPQANNNGPSISLIRTNANETLASCWAPSASSGGTPGSPNNLNSAWVASRGGSCTNVAYAQSSTGSPSGGGGGGGDNTGGSSGGSTANESSGGDTATPEEQQKQEEAKKKKEEVKKEKVEEDQAKTALDIDGDGIVSDEEAKAVGITRNNNGTALKVVAFIVLLSSSMLIIFHSSYKKKLAQLRKAAHHVAHKKAHSH